MAQGLTATVRKRRAGRSPADDFTLDVSLTLAPGSITALVGPSGAGKTTLLRCLAGLERPDAGRIAWGDDGWYGAGTSVVPPQQRRAGYVFDEAVLFPHLTALQNVAFSRGQWPEAGRLLAVMELDTFAARYPRQLSGGQQQRVAIARAMAGAESLLLMDEPFASLDAPLKQRLYAPFQREVRSRGLAVLLVTHDLAEAGLLADQLVVLDRGRLLQADTPLAVVRRPADARVARLLGEPNVFESPTDGTHVLHWGPWRLQTDGELPGDAPCHWLIRPDRVALSEEAGAGPNAVPGRIAGVAPHEGALRVWVQVDDVGVVESRTALTAPWHAGLAVTLSLPPEAIERLGRATP